MRGGSELYYRRETGRRRAGGLCVKEVFPIEICEEEGERFMFINRVGEEGIEVEKKGISFSGVHPDTKLSKPLPTT